MLGLAAGYKFRINGGGKTDEVIDVGLPSPLKFVYTDSVLPDTEYSVEKASYDHFDNQSDWGTPVVFTTPLVSQIWEANLNTHWDLDGSNNFVANANTAEDFIAVAVPRLVEIGDYIEMSFSNTAGDGFNALFHLRILDEASHYIFTYVNSQINDEIGFLTYAQAYTKDDLIRFTKTSANRISMSVNGAPDTEIPKDLTGALKVQMETASYIGLTVNAFTTNIIF